MPPIPDLPEDFCQEFSPTTGLAIFFKGRPLSDGPLPALIYFCSTGRESLCTDPYNQPIAFLNDLPIRVFSMSLPSHEEGIDNRRSVSRWAQQYALGNDLLSPFLELATQNIQYLVDAGIAQPDSIAVGGLSRGGFIAAHLAARSPHIRAVLGFSPLTDLFCLEEFKPMRDNTFLRATALSDIAEYLVGKSLRFYIGNRDMRVSTDACFAFVRHLTELSFAQGKRSPPVELILFPSSGHLGHGTSPRIFRSGAQWISETLDLTRTH